MRVEYNGTVVETPACRIDGPHGPVYVAETDSERVRLSLQKGPDGALGASGRAVFSRDELGPVLGKLRGLGIEPLGQWWSDVLLAKRVLGAVRVESVSEGPGAWRRDEVETDCRGDSSSAMSRGNDARTRKQSETSSPKSVR